MERRGSEAEGRACGLAAAEVGNPGAPARSGPARSEAVVGGEDTGGADGRAEGGKRAGERSPSERRRGRVTLPFRAGGAVRRAETKRTRTGSEALIPPPQPGLPRLRRSRRGARFPRTPSPSSPQSLSSAFRKPRRQPGPLAGRMTELQSALLLRRQLAELNKNPVEGFSAGLIDDNDLYRWEVLIIGPPDTLYEGGVFKAHLTFPKDYPLRPPKMKFITEIWHPNVDKNGDVCISILHEPGEDKYGYEKPEERWLPIHTVETIMISVISMLADPNGDSPANVDAAKEWREDRNGEFKRKVARCVRKSQETAFE
ncbi:ubiquitin-conjugating enzyme E2 G1 [Saccopteryx leptura]|uniref:ubiquitin-conjugating enzyme E2 G1 n=1 Tax=Saccopteryx leptura TaxID=249018 RepID=UPI00339BFBA4